MVRTRAERAVATALEGSCQVPLAVFADLDGERIELSALVGTPDGATVVRSTRAGRVAEVDALAAAVSEDLLKQGAGEIIAGLR